MGTSGFTQCMWKSVPLQWEHIVYLLHELNKNVHLTNSESIDTNNISYSPPVIDIDANNIGYKALNSPFSFIRDCLRLFIHSGLESHVIVDGKNRHHSKRDSFNRRAKILRCNILAESFSDISGISLLLLHN